MPQTGKGIEYPDSSGNVRLWEWFASLASTADAAIPGSVDVQVFTSSGTWTKPEGALWVDVEVQGGGGGSGGCPSISSSQGACSPGAGGGEYARGTFQASALSSTVTVTVGAAGSAGSAGSNDGGNGGTSSFGSLITAVGGSGGVAGVASTGASNSIGGGNGGTGGTGGTVRLPGGGGGPGQTLSGYPLKSNYGGDSHFASVTRATGTAVNQSSGFTGASYGGGASGASNSKDSSTLTAIAGAAGGPGIVIVTTYQA